MNKYFVNVKLGTDGRMLPGRENVYGQLLAKPNERFVRADGTTTSSILVNDETLLKLQAAIKAAIAAAPTDAHFRGYTTTTAAKTPIRRWSLVEVNGVIRVEEALSRGEFLNQLAIRRLEIEATAKGFFDGLEAVTSEAKAIDADVAVLS